MKGVMKWFALAAIALSTTVAHAHDDESRVSIESDMTGPVQAGSVKYVFQLVDTELNKLVKDSDLSITHEKILHMIVYDPALKEFQHVHPNFDGTNWSADLNFAVDGEYWVWTQGQLSVDGEEFSSSVRLKVRGGSQAWPAPPVLTDNRQGADQISTVTLSNDKLKAGQMAMVMVTLGRNDGSIPQNTPYLGAFAHVIAVPKAGDSLLHVHPMNGAHPNEGMLHVLFPEAGYYRLWVQFMDDGYLRTVPLSVQVY